MALTEERPVRAPYLWPKGVSGNPKAGHKVAKGLQEPSPRMKLLLERHGVAKILQAAKDPAFLDANFGGYDGMLIVALANALQGNETAIENRLNRMFGKVPDKQVNLNLNVDASPQQLSDRAQALLGNLAGDSGGDEEPEEDDLDLIEE